MKKYTATKQTKGGWLLQSKNGDGENQSAHSDRKKVLSRIFFENPHVEQFEIIIPDRERSK